MEKGTILPAMRKKISTTQILADASVGTENGTNIQKVLGVCAKPSITSVEVLNGEADMETSVLFDVVFLDDTGKVCSVQENVTISSKIDDSKLSTQMEPIYKVEVVDCAVDSATLAEVRVSATLEISLEVIDFSEISCYESANDNVLVKKENYTVLTKCCSGKDIVNIDDEFDLKHSIQSVVCQSADVIVKQITAGIGYYTIDGEISLKAYLCNVDDEQYSYKLFSETIPFKEEVDAQDMQKDCIIHANVCVKHADVKFEITGDNNNVLKVSVPLSVRYVALKQQECALACDAYSLTHKLNLVTDTYFDGKINRSTHKKHIEGNIEIGENMPRIAKMLMIMDASLNISNVLNTESGARVEGVLTSTVVYKADDDDESLNSVQVEVPFSINLDDENIKQDDELYVFGSLIDTIVKAKKGKELEIDADVVFNVESYFAEPQSYVKDVVLTEEITQTPYPLCFYLAPAGCTLWDISKHLNVKEEIILEQNPNLEYPLQTSQSIVYFNQK